MSGRRARSRARGAPLTLVLSLTVAAGGCGEPPWMEPPEPAGLVDAALATRPHEPGEATWQRHCAICHGTAGAADGFNASLLPVAPPGAPVMAARGAGLAAAIAEGSASRGASPLCPPWAGALSPAEIDEVAAHVGRLGRAR